MFFGHSNEADPCNDVSQPDKDGCEVQVADDDELEPTFDSVKMVEMGWGGVKGSGRCEFLACGATGFSLWLIHFGIPF